MASLNRIAKTETIEVQTMDRPCFVVFNPEKRHLSFDKDLLHAFDSSSSSSFLFSASMKSSNSKAKGTERTAT